MTAFRAAFKAYRMHQVLLLPRFARLTIALGLATAVFPVDAEYYFNPRFLSNDLAESVDLSAFTKGREAPPGTYRVDIYLNDEFMTSRDITFIADDNNADLIPCLSTDLLVSLGIKKSALLDNKEHSAEKHVSDNSACTPLRDRLADASSEFNVGQQHLSLSVPQINLLAQHHWIPQCVSASGETFVAFCYPADHRLIVGFHFIRRVDKD